MRAEDIESLSIHRSIEIARIGNTPEDRFARSLVAHLVHTDETIPAHLTQEAITNDWWRALPLRHGAALDFVSETPTLLPADVIDGRMALCNARPSLLPPVALQGMPLPSIMPQQSSCSTFWQHRGLPFDKNCMGAPTYIRSHSKPESQNKGLFCQ